MESRIQPKTHKEIIDILCEDIENSYFKTVTIAEMHERIVDYCIYRPVTYWDAVHTLKKVMERLNYNYIEDIKYYLDLEFNLK